jgi:glycosyltransferase involved in cell wall biosynthesis
LCDFSDLFSTKLLDLEVLKNVYAWSDPRKIAAGLHRAQQCYNFIQELNWEPELVHSHFASLPTFTGRYVATIYSIPHTVTTHAFDLYDDPDPTLQNKYICGADHVVTISEYNRRTIREKIGCSNPVSVVHAGIRPEKFQPTRQTVDGRILTVARFVEKKGIDDALAAVARMEQSEQNLEYHIIGDGPKKDHIIRRIRELGIGNVVDLLGNVSDQRLIQEYDEARCFLLPSIIAASGDRDGIPVVLMEAMAMETPAVSTTVSGIPELVIDGKNGLLAEPGDIDTLAKHIDRILSNTTKRDEFGRRSRERIKTHFNIANETDKLELIFSGVIDRSENRV